MRCRKVRQRLTEAGGNIEKCLQDKDLKEHLDHCTECKSYLQTRLMVQRDLETLRADDLKDSISFPELKATVNRKAADDRSRLKEMNIMKILSYPFLKRPRLGITIALGIIVLTFITLVPLKLQQTIGYEVAFAGVDENLVVDQQKAEKFLTKLGLDSAELEVSDCEKTCKVQVYNLKSEDEVELVITAFDEMGNSKLETVQKIKGKENITLAKHFKNVIWINDNPDGTKHEIKTDKIVLTAMGETDGDSATFNIWIAKDSDAVDISGHEIIFLDSSQTAHQVILDKSGNQSGIKYFEVTASDDPEGERIMIFHDEDGVVHELDLSDPNLEQKIKDLGLNIQIYNEGEEPEEVTEFMESGIYPSQKQGSAVPDQYELKQNYPNPFNPTTDIRFAIPKSGHVTLEVYNIQGRLVRSLIDRELSAGEHIVQWDSTDDNGNAVASGTYLYRLTTDEYIDSKKMTLVK
jgi:hypothetical protein